MGFFLPCKGGRTGMKQDISPVLPGGIGMDLGFLAPPCPALLALKT